MFFRRIVFSLCMTLLWSTNTLAKDYYIAKTGADTNPGTLEQPFLTIQRAANIMVAGDTAFIRAGVYRETVRPTNSGVPGAPITFQPYNGETVTVSGADVIASNSWTVSGGSIYKAPMSFDLGEGLNQIFLDGQMMIEARWPNTTLDVSHPVVAVTGGGSYVDGGTNLSTGTITGPDLPSRAAGYWNGATIHISLFNVDYDQGPGWLWQTGSVVGSAPGQLTFTFRKMVTVLDQIIPGPKDPYYLTGKLPELDAAGEWFRDSASSTLYLWTPSGASPSQNVVEAKRRQLAFNLAGRSFIAVQGLGLFAASIFSDSQSQYLVLDGLKVQYVSHNLAIPNPSLSFVGFNDSGILLNGRNNVLRNSSISFSSGNAVLVAGFGHRVYNNVIRDADYAGNEASPIAAGYNTLTSGFLIAWNTIYNAGRHGILHTNLNPNSGHGRILHNEIYNYGLQTSDLGCIYTYGSDNHGTEIAYNWCHHDSGAHLGTGIYLDFDTSNNVVHHNVVWSTYSSTRLNTVSSNNKVYNNTFAGNQIGLMATPGHDNVFRLPGTELKNNIFTRILNAGAIAPGAGATLQNNLLQATDPRFVDAAQNNFQLQSSSPAIDGGLALPPYTDGFVANAPDIGAYEFGATPWKAGAQANAAIVSAGNAQWMSSGTPATALVSGLTGPLTVIVTDGAGIDRAARILEVTATGVTFEVPAGTAAGIALVTITSGNGNISLGAAPVFSTYYFPHLALGGGWQTTLTYVNYSQQAVTCNTSFFSDSGAPLPVAFAGATASTRTDLLAAGATVHQQSQANLNAPVGTGWAQAQCSGPVKASLLFRSYVQGVANGEAGVNAMTAPASGFVSCADAQTGIAYANPFTQPSVVTITAVNAAGLSAGSASFSLAPGQHGAGFVGPLLNLSTFVGSVRITATAPIISLSLNFEAVPAFSSLPPGESTASAPSTTYFYHFAHMALGGGWQTTVTYVNSSSQVVTCQTSFFADSGAPLAVSFGGSAASTRSDTLAPGGSVHQQSQANLNAAVVSGWAQAQCNGPVKASLLFRYYSQGAALAEAGVNAMSAAATQFVTFAETSTGVAYANPSAQPATITFTAFNSTGQPLGSKSLTLAPQQHGSAFFGPLLALSSFTGSVQIASTAPIVSLSLNFEAAPVFSSLPPGEID